jgi:cardiolipin synthase A/B
LSVSWSSYCGKSGAGQRRENLPKRFPSFYQDYSSKAKNAIYEYKDGLLHTKSLTLDGEVSLIGSANMDRRSFELNYENNILFYDSTLTGVIRERQQEYIARSPRITKEAVAAWPLSRRLWNNLIATVGPVL